MYDVSPKTALQNQDKSLGTVCYPRVGNPPSD